MHRFPALSFIFFEQFLVLILLLFLLQSPAAAAAASSTPGSSEDDRLALLAFKKSILHDPRNSLDSWSTTALNFCDWNGVVCDGERRVTSLVLHSLDLEGTLSPSLTNLTFLQQLDLSDNRLSGDLPAEICPIRRLLSLNLSSNSLSGSISPILGLCAGLSVLDLSYNQISGHIPAELGSLSELTFLNLRANNLTGSIPSSIGNLSSLKTLVFAYNDLGGTIPSSITNLSSLSFLRLSYNNLEGSLPEGLGRLTSLQYIFMTKNNLSGSIPKSLGNASGLLQIDFSYNNFLGVIPTEIGKLQELFWFSVGSNRLQASSTSDWEFISSLTNCTELETLILAQNDLGGILPSTIANLSAATLTTLQMGVNQISGTIPQGIDNLVELTKLLLNDNNLAGNIPDFVGKLQNLNALALSGNRFSGTIPTILGNLTRLIELYLGGNDLEGNIPGSLSKCQQLNSFSLWNNRLNGSIPKEIFSLTALSNLLDLSSNYLSGTLPVEVGNLRYLQNLYISNNMLSGGIPTALGDCLTMEKLNLSGNNFQGSIPLSLSKLRGIKNLDLSSNNLSGEVPHFLAELPELIYLNLSFNDLGGELPIEGVFQNTSELSILGNNRLCGGITVLHLHSCLSTTPKKKFPILKVIIPVAVLFFVFSLFITYYILSKSEKHSEEFSENDSWRVSYEELMKATDEFSSDNLVGIGGYGSVYQGAIGNDKTIVAIKVLDLKQRGAIKTFVAECKALRNVRHRNLVKIITICVSVDMRGNEFRALVFEFMSNGSLDRWLHPKPDEKSNSKWLDLGQLLSIAMDVASALHYLHNNLEMPIIHCDLKPSNILLDDNMTARVGDFGISKFLAESSSNYASSSLVARGTIGYVAPEYGIGSQVSTQSDVYSYGIVLLEMFTGIRPSDDIFRDGLTLQKLVTEEIARGGARGVAEPSLFAQEVYPHNKLEECIESIMIIGLSCAKELPRERPSIQDVLSKMQCIKSVLTSTQ